MGLIKGNNEDFEYILENNSLTIFPRSELTLENADKYRWISKDFKFFKDIKSLKLDFKDLEGYDSFLVALIISYKKECESRQIKFETINLSNEALHFVNTLTPKVQTTQKVRKNISFENYIREVGQKQSFFYKYVSEIGKNTINMLSDISSFLDFLGSLVSKMIIVWFRPGKMRWRDFPYHFLQAGVNAVPITLMIVFLIGLVSGYQGALELSKVGADIFIADLVGVSITRELAPLMTAIIVAGRSGSAYAAEIGTMKVSEEVDALSSMGFDSIYFLVLPRVLAVMIAMPILVILNDVAGIAGGLVAGLSTLDITIAGYINQLTRALTFGHIFTGIGKSVIFGFLISAIGCFRGLQVRGGAESVGRYTTASVVSGIFLIILFDALFTYVFQVIGI